MLLFRLVNEITYLTLNILHRYIFIQVPYSFYCYLDVKTNAEIEVVIGLAIKTIKLMFHLVSINVTFNL
ncbi:Putative helicase [Moritella viscosa]|nr:putative uncharacterized protein [Moritella viscosa]SHO23588.1 Putative helicase [Moritella viscosa]